MEGGDSTMGFQPTRTVGPNLSRPLLAYRGRRPAKCFISSTCYPNICSLKGKGLKMGDPTSIAIANANSNPRSDIELCNGNGPTDYAEIIVVRHGETAWNADGRIQGHLDVDLNEVGRQQAAAVAERLSKETAISAVYSSDLKRASETADIIARSCGVLEVMKDADLRERHLGDVQGLTLHEAAKLKPDAYQACISSKPDQEIPGGGESLDQLYHRCTSSLQRLGMKYKGKRVVVVSHGGVLRALHKRASPREVLPGRIQNASLNIFHLRDEDWTIKTWGDIEHVNKIGYLETAFGGDSSSG